MSAASVVVEAMERDDWEAVRAIYEQGIVTGDATFATQSPTWEEWDGAHLVTPRLVARIEGRVVGWAALAPSSKRFVYRGVAELSIYVATEARGAGVGRALLSRLVAASEEAGIWTLQAGIFPENSASLALHERAGFRVLGRQERVGRMSTGEWRDVVLLERRSRTVGID